MMRCENILKEAYKEYFSVGVAINTRQLMNEDDLKVIKKHFNSVTMENEMKPEMILDWEGSKKSEDGMPAIQTKPLQQILSLAKENGLKLRGHTLVWHNQTPKWFFHDEYDISKNKADKETMLRRLECYIKRVITYCNENYPGVVYAWDVVNEAVSDKGGYRKKSPWYEITGPDFFEKAFEYARRYATVDTKLFYNDYNTYDIEKQTTIYEIVKELAEKKLINGVGLQSHWDIDKPSVSLIISDVEKYSDVKELEIQLTEVDMHTNDNSTETMQNQAERYERIFEQLLELKKKGKANVTNVTFWGLNDGVTWLTSFRKEKSYPLLFDENNQPKKVLERLLQVSITH